MTSLNLGVDEVKPSYVVVIIQNNDEARLDCDTYEEALSVKRSFENYGKYESITIERVEQC